MGATVDGLVTGLSTSQLIDQLMQAEAAPQRALRTKVSLAQQVLSAYQSVNSQFAGLLTAANSLLSPGSWQAVKATSSTESVVATASAGASQGSLAFDVVRTAARQSYLSSQTYSGLGATALTGASFSLTDASGTTTTVTPTDGSLASVVAAVNASGTGVRASAVNLGNGSYALQLTSATTGAAGGFTVSGLDGTFVETSTAADAVIRFGAGTAAEHDVTSASNTFTNLVPGVTVTVSGPAVGVRVDLTQDAGALADSVEALVKAANAALDEIAKNASYTPGKGGGVLMSDLAVRGLQQGVLETVSRALGGGTARDAGVSLTRDGHLSFSRAEFLTAYAADPAKVQRLVAGSATFAPSAAFSGTVSMFRASAATTEVSGGYAVVVSQAATRATAQVDVGALDSTSTVTVAGVTVTAADGDTAADFTGKVNAALAAKGYGASLSGTTMTITATSYGSGSTFTPTVAGTGLTVTAVAAGADVAGSIGGIAATGTGQLLTAAAGSPAAGLSLLVTLSPADVAAAGGGVGTVTYTGGVAQRLGHVARAATDTVIGSLTTSIRSRQDAIKGYNDDISDWDVRLQTRRKALQTQFANLEVALGRLRDQSSWLAGQLASLSR